MGPNCERNEAKMFTSLTISEQFVAHIKDMGLRPILPKTPSSVQLEEAGDEDEQ